MSPFQFREGRVGSGCGGNRTDCAAATTSISYGNMVRLRQDAVHAATTAQVLLWRSHRAAPGNLG